MIKFTKDGIAVDEVGWHAANPHTDRGTITVFFQDCPPVTLDEAFLERALYLIQWDRKRTLERRTDSDQRGGSHG